MLKTITPLRLLVCFLLDWLGLIAAKRFNIALQQLVQEENDQKHPDFPELCEGHLSRRTAERFRLCLEYFQNAKPSCNPHP